MSINEIYEVCPGVWFGPYDFTYNLEYISNFTHIINLDTFENSTSNDAKIKCKFRHFPAYDNPSYRILDIWLDKVKEFICDAKQTYIHCYMGSNRSAAIAIAIAMDRTGEHYKIILDKIRKKITSRPILENEGFLDQLHALQETHDALIGTRTFIGENLGVTAIEDSGKTIDTK